MLSRFAQALVSGAIRVVDLSQPLDAEYRSHSTAAGIWKIVAVPVGGNF